MKRTQSLLTRNVAGRCWRVLHVFGRMSRGGAELRTIEVVRAMKGQRVRHDFCALSGLAGELDEEIRALGGNVHLQALGPTFPLRFRQLLRSERYDAVHSHVHYFSGAILRLAAGEAIPIRIAHFRSTHDGKGDSWRRRLRNRLLARGIDRYATDILAVSRAAMCAAWSSHWQQDGRCQVVYNGFPLPETRVKDDREEMFRELGLSRGARLFVHVGNFVEAKNHLKLVEIFARIVKVAPESRLMLVGDARGPVGHAVRARVKALGLAAKTVLTGTRGDVPRLLHAADTLIFPSLREGSPGALIEACAAGVPVLASDLAAIREIAEHFPQFETLSCDSSDDCWATRALDLSRNRQRGEHAAEAGRLAFAASPFRLEACLAAYRKVWLGEHNEYTFAATG